MCAISKVRSRKHGREKLKNKMFCFKFLTFLLTLMSCQQLKAMDVQPKIVIIGAGPSGLAAATKLLEYGFKNFTILEAESRIGGRIHTIPFADNVVDLGAQWCHGEKDNVVYEMVEKYDLLQHSTAIERNSSFVRSNGEIMDHKLSSRLIEIIDEIVETKVSELLDFNGSFADFIAENYYASLQLPKNQDIGREIADEALASYDKARCSADGCDTLSQVSARLLLDYKDCEGDHLLTWKKKGYKAFLEVLLKTHETGKDYGVLQDHIQISKNVKQIQWQRNDGKVLVKTVTGADILADHVIVTVSLGVLKAKHMSLFEPPLPAQKTKAIENLAIGTVNKIFLAFEEPFWPSYWSGVSLLWRKEDLAELKATNREWLTDIFGFYIVADQPRILSAWMNGPHRAEIEKLDIDEAKNASMYLLKRFLANSAFKVSEPLSIVRTTWGSEENFRGTYSYQSMETEAAGVKFSDIAEPLLTNDAAKKPLVLFAGEATHSHYYGTVHGAVETGYREAKRLKDFYEAIPQIIVHRHLENIFRNLISEKFLIT